MSGRTKYLFKPCSLCGTREVCREVTTFEEASVVWAEARRRGLPHQLAIDVHTITGRDAGNVESLIGPAYVCGNCNTGLQEKAGDAAPRTFEDFDEIDRLIGETK